MTYDLVLHGTGGVKQIDVGIVTQGPEAGAAGFQVNTNNAPRDERQRNYE